MAEIANVPLPSVKRFEGEELLTEATTIYQQMRLRRTVRDFSSKPVPQEVIENALLAAGTAPSGANLQPWHFAAISNPAIKQQIRIAAEEEERIFYEHRAPKEWLEALAPLGTDANKPFLETAPWLIAIFVQPFGTTVEGKTFKHYYATESVGIATGMLITTLHRLGLASLTHTPSPMKFLNQILNRPEHERPFLLLVTGYPAEDAKVPDIQRKALIDICSFI